ncbi:MAG: PAS domain S-box protein [Gallionellaceae bacterium]|jgi:diguanylate cyclase (GGDEF)-like protein/PAS domain S-box-containing protein
MIILSTSPEIAPSRYVVIRRKAGRFLPNFAIVACLVLLASSTVQALTPIKNSSIAHQSAPIIQLQKETLVVGSEQDYPPFSTGMTDATAGGFTVDLWKAVAAEAGLNYSIRVLPFHQLLEEFKEGKIDVLINLAQSDERHHFADFTVPHVVVHGAIFVRKGESGIHSEGDFAGKSIIVLNADLAHDYAVSKGWEKQLVLVDTAAEGLRLLASGKHDAMLLSKLAGMQMLQALEITNIEALKGSAGFSQKFAFAVSEGQSELLGKINEGMALTKTNGTYNTLYDKWFGIYEVKEIGLSDLLKYLIPIIVFFMGVGGYLLYRRQVEREEAEKKYRDLYDHAPDMFLSVEAKSAIVIDCNQTLLNSTGYTRDEVVGHPVLDLYHPDCSDSACIAFQTFIKTKALHGVELQLRRKDGKKIDVSVNASAVCDEHGVILHSRSALRDVTERKQAEESILKLSLAVAQSPNSIVITDLDANIEFVNTAFIKTTGYSFEDAVGKNPRLLHSGKTPKSTYDEMWACLVRGDPWEGEFTNCRKDGTEYIELARIAPVRQANGRISHYLAVKEDITERKQSEKLLRKSTEELEDLYNHAPCGYHSLDKDGVIMRINDTELEWLGYTRDELIGKVKLSDLLTPASLESFRKAFPVFKRRGVLHDFELELVRKDGTILNGLANATLIRDADGEYLMSRSTLFDITERKKTEDTLRSMFSAIEHSPIGVLITDAEANIQYVSPRFSAITGYKSADLIRRNLRLLQMGQIAKDTYLEIWNTLTSGHSWHGELVNKNKRGRVYWEEVHIAPVATPDGIVTNYAVVIADISERKEAEEKMQHMARYDQLTDLPNRSMVDDRLQQALAAAKREKTQTALMFIDLDKFKPINDTLGHDAGDMVLKEAAKRMQSCVRESDTVGRIGGDEFVVLLTTVDSNQDAALVAEKIRHALNQPIALLGQHLHISSSIGVAIYPEHGTDGKTLVKNADAAMYYAKEGGRNSVKMFEPEMLQ